MFFLYPKFLWALLAVAIPIIIHLFNLRAYKTVYFSNVKFLENIEKQTKARSRLKYLLVLLIRILTIASLVIAFAQPIILKNKNALQNVDCQNIAVIYTDNSFSMNAEGEYGRNLDVAKAKALAILDAYPKDAKFLFLTNDLLPKHQRFYYKDIIKTFIAQTRSSYNIQPLSKIVQKAVELFKEEAPNCKISLYLISDFQKISADFENFPSDTGIFYYFVPVQAPSVSNLYIDSVYFFSPYRVYLANDSLGVKIVNHSDKNFDNVQIKFLVNDTVKALKTASIDANTSKEIKLYFSNLKRGKFCARVEISDYPITYDNVKYFIYKLKNKIPVLLIKNKKTNNFLSTFYADTVFFELDTANEKNIPYSSFKKYEIIVLQQIKNISSGLISSLQEYVGNGGVVVFLPSMSGEIENYNELLQNFGFNTFRKADTFATRVKQINIKDLIYKNAIADLPPNALLPKINKHFVFDEKNLSDYTSLLKAENGDNLLIYRNIGEGKFYVFTFNLNKKISDFAIHPLMSPTFYNVAVFNGTDAKIYYTLGKDKFVLMKNIQNTEVIKLKNNKDNFEIIPPVLAIGPDLLKVNISNLKQNGCYDVFSDNTEIDKIALNYNTKESDFKFFTTDELKKVIKKYNIKNSEILTSKPATLAQELKETSKGLPLWKYFILLALFFLAIEIAILRLWK